MWLPTLSHADQSRPPRVQRQIYIRGCSLVTFTDALAQHPSDLTSADTPTGITGHFEHVNFGV